MNCGIFLAFGNSIFEVESGSAWKQTTVAGQNVAIAGGTQDADFAFSASIAIDPFGKETGYRLVEVEADAVTVSHEHGDHNNVSLVKGRGGSSPQVFRGTRNNLRDWVEVPRGTRVRDVALHSVGVYHDDVEGKKIGKNAAFVLP